jgi:hypothetical protein
MMKRPQQNSEEETWFPGFLSPRPIYHVPKRALEAINEMDVLPFFYDTETDQEGEIVLFTSLFTALQQRTLEDQYGMKPVTVTMLDDEYDELLYGPALKPFAWTAHRAVDLFVFEYEVHHETVLLIDAPLSVVRQAFEESEERILPGFSTVEIYWEKQSEDLFLLDEDDIRLLSYSFVSYMGTDASIERALEVVQTHPDRLSIDGGVQPVTMREFLQAYREHLTTQSRPYRTLKKLKEVLTP